MFDPLVLGSNYACAVIIAGMQEYDAAPRGGGNG